jgi:hypothetical protein
MAKWFSEDAEYSQISERDHGIRRVIEKALATHTREMEGYSYYGSNPGISEDDYDDVAESIMTALDLWEVKNGV